MSNESTHPTPDDAASSDGVETPVEAAETVDAPSTDAVATTAAAGEVAEPAGARELVREKAQRVKQRQARTRLATRSAVVIIVLAIIAAAAVVVWSVVSAWVDKPNPTPAGLQNDGFVITESGASFVSSAGNGSLGDPSPTPTADPTAEATAEATPEPTPTTTRMPVQVDMYVDFLNPESAQFMLANGAQLAKLVRDGSITLTLHPVSVMTASSNGTKYSQRAAGAVACVARYTPDAVFAYSFELMSKQPKVDTDGLSDEELADTAIAIGATNPEGVRECISEGTYTRWVSAATERATTKALPRTDEPLSVTPTVIVNGILYVGAYDDPQEFLQFAMVQESTAEESTPGPSNTSTPSATPTPTPSA